MRGASSCKQASECERKQSGEGERKVSERKRAVFSLSPGSIGERRHLSLTHAAH